MEIIATDPNDQRKIDYTRENHGIIIGYAACPILILIGVIHVIVGNGNLLIWFSFVSLFILVRLTTYSWPDNFGLAHHFKPRSCTVGILPEILELEKKYIMLYRGSLIATGILLLLPLLLFIEDVANYFNIKDREVETFGYFSLPSILYFGVAAFKKFTPGEKHLFKVAQKFYETGKTERQIKEEKRQEQVREKEERKRQEQQQIAEIKRKYGEDTEVVCLKPKICINPKTKTLVVEDKEREFKDLWSFKTREHVAKAGYYVPEQVTSSTTTNRGYAFPVAKSFGSPVMAINQHSQTTYHTTGGYSVPDEIDYYIIELEWREELHHQELTVKSKKDFQNIEEGLRFVRRNS